MNELCSQNNDAIGTAFYKASLNSAISSLRLDWEATMLGPTEDQRNAYVHLAHAKALTYTVSKMIMFQLEIRSLPLLKPSTTCRALERHVNNPTCRALPSKSSSTAAAAACEALACLASQLTSLTA